MAAVPSEEGVLALAHKPNKLREGFISLAESLLASISDVFPECKETERVLAIFRTLVKGDDTFEDKFVRKCHAVFKIHADSLKQHEAEALFSVTESLDYVRDIDLRTKWEDPDFTDTSRAHLWQYIATLKTYADLYTAVPKEVMGKIESVAGNIGEQLSRGELDLAHMDLNKIGQTLLSDLTPDELSGFEGNLPDIISSMSNVAGSLGASAPGLDVAGLMQQMAAQAGEGSGELPTSVDMTRVLQQLSAQQAPVAGTSNTSPVDLNQMLHTLGPLLSAMQPPQPVVLEDASTMNVRTQPCKSSSKKGASS